MSQARFAARLTVDVVPSLIKALQRPERDVRFYAAQLLGRLGPAAEPAVPALLAILKEPSDPTSSDTSRDLASQLDPAWSAAISLSQISASPQVIAGLIEVLSSGTPERRNCAAEGLDTLGPRAIDAMPALIAAYHRILTTERDTLGQNEVAKAIGQIAPHSASAPRAVVILIRALDSSDSSVRHGAVEALGKFGDDAAGAVPKLRDIELTDTDTSGQVKAAATAALAEIEGAPGADRP